MCWVQDSHQHLTDTPVCGGERQDGRDVGVEVKGGVCGFDDVEEWGSMLHERALSPTTATSADPPPQER